jgi:hypothetical protein
VALPGAYAPSSIAFRVIAARKLPLHDNAVVLEVEVIHYYWLTIVVLVEVADVEDSFI